MRECVLPGRRGDISHRRYAVIHIYVVERLAGVVLDEGHDHAVEVEEEHDQVKCELRKGFLQGGTSALVQPGKGYCHGDLNMGDPPSCGC